MQFLLLILASASKARQRLLNQVQIPHQVVVSGLNEESIGHSNPQILVQLLAEAKAEAVFQKISSDNHFSDLSAEKVTAVLGCDSLFEFEGEVFGKPSNEKEAISRWHRMQSNFGILHTGHALAVSLSDSNCLGHNSQKRLIKETISTKVFFSKMTTQEIEHYVSSGEPMNCAGGFAIEGAGGIFIASIEGCFSNVIGLSLPWLRRSLSMIGVLT